MKNGFRFIVAATQGFQGRPETHQLTDRHHLEVSFAGKSSRRNLLPRVGLSPLGPMQTRKTGALRNETRDFEFIADFHPVGRRRPGDQKCPPRLEGYPVARPLGGDQSADSLKVVLLTIRRPLTQNFYRHRRCRERIGDGRCEDTHKGGSRGIETHSSANPLIVVMHGDHRTRFHARVQQVRRRRLFKALHSHEDFLVPHRDVKRAMQPFAAVVPHHALEGDPLGVVCAAAQLPVVDHLSRGQLTRAEHLQ